jgi:hypothetical protein
MYEHEKLRKSWIWGGDVTDFVKSKIHGKVLNAPCGKSQLGDVRFDKDHEHDPHVIGDINKLPFADESFDCVIQDPPWKIGFYQRMKPFFECVRVCKVGGKIIYNAYWIPHTNINGLLELEEVYIRQDKPFTNTSIISVWKKLNKEHKENDNSFRR